MAVRREIERLVALGKLPSEESEEEKISQVEQLVHAISLPVSDEEAQLLTTIFGSDDCYGISWTLLHIIETAPNARSATYECNKNNLWVKLLNARVAAAQ